MSRKARVLYTLSKHSPVELHSILCFLQITSLYIAQAGLTLIPLLPHPPKPWVHRCVSPSPVKFIITIIPMFTDTLLPIKCYAFVKVYEIYIYTYIWMLFLPAFGTAELVTASFWAGNTLVTCSLEPLSRWQATSPCFDSEEKSTWHLFGQRDEKWELTVFHLYVLKIVSQAQKLKVFIGHFYLCLWKLLVYYFFYWFVRTLLSEK